jgi:hypothetical protein
MVLSAQEIAEKQESILHKIAQIRVMHRGTVSRQTYPERAKRHEGEGAVGPYCLWQGTVSGKRFGKRLSGPEALQVEKCIAQRHAFEALCEEYIELSCQLAARISQGDACQERIKKKPKSPSNRAKK